MTRTHVRTTLEFSDTHLKLMQSSNGRTQRKLDFVEVRDIASLSDEEISRQLKKLMTGKRAGDKLTVVIPRREVMLRPCRVPSHNEAESRTMVEWQACQHIPYERKDVIIDSYVLEKLPDGYTKVLALIVRCESIERYVSILNEAQCPVGRVTFSTAGLMCWKLWQDKNISPQYDHYCALINCEEGQTEICFCSKDKFLFSRSLAFGTRDALNGSAQPFADQISAAFKAFSLENREKDISEIIILSIKELE